MRRRERGGRSYQHYQAGGGEKGRRQGLAEGWWRILSWSSEREMICQPSSLRSRLARLEAEMADFYSPPGQGSRLRPGRVRTGDLLAALHSDLAWHRARVLQVGPDWLLLLYLDWGWQAVTVRWKSVKLVGGVREDWAELVREGRVRLRLVESERDQQGVWRGEIRLKLTGGS